MVGMPSVVWLQERHRGKELSCPLAKEAGIHLWRDLLGAVTCPIIFRKQNMATFPPCGSPVALICLPWAWKEMLPAFAGRAWSEDPHRAGSMCRASSDIKRVTSQIKGTPHDVARGTLSFAPAPRR